MPTQRPFGLRDEAAELLGLSPARIHVHPQAMGGMVRAGQHERRGNGCPLAPRAAHRPVLVQWTRADEFRLSPQRPILDADIRAALDTTDVTR